MNLLRLILTYHFKPFLTKGEALDLLLQIQYECRCRMERERPVRDIRKPPKVGNVDWMA